MLIIPKATYGFSELLKNPHTRIRIEGKRTFLVFPEQPANIFEWQNLDCFGFAYAVFEQLRNNPDALIVRMAQVNLSAPSIANYKKRYTYHVVTSVQWKNGKSEIYDLTPLSVENTAFYKNLHFFDTGDKQFELWRHAVPFSEGQPMLVDSKYYILADTLIFSDSYQFTLMCYEFTPATPTKAIKFHKGVAVGYTILKKYFFSLRQKVREGGILKREPLVWLGDSDKLLRECVEKHFDLFNHMIGKLEPQS